jgi:hemerythrin-like domain-containing protein
MSDPIARLGHEHRLIERLLGSLELFADRLGSSSPDERLLVRDFAGFFQDYVDTVHHGKEEHLFTRLQKYGFPRDSGPVSALLYEHEEGRDHLGALAAIGALDGPMSQEERQLAQGHALGYVMRLGPHIHREDVLLFPLISRSVAPEVLGELAQDFDRFDRTVEESGLLFRLEQIARRLEAEFPPDPSRLPSSYLPGGMGEEV